MLGALAADHRRRVRGLCAMYKAKAEKAQRPSQPALLAPDAVALMNEERCCETNAFSDV